MNPYLIVTGDFVKTGGMDRANYALADYLARHGYEVHLVAYRVAPELLSYPNVFFHKVPKLANSYFLSTPLLSQLGNFWARRISRRNGRVIVNGGNCRWPDVNWVHFVHAAYESKSKKDFLNSIKARLFSKVDLFSERKSLYLAKVIIANSNATKKYLAEKIRIPLESINVIYLGVDDSIYYPVSSSEKENLRKKIGFPLGKPLIIYIGSLIDYRKGFDILFEAWKQLCYDINWDVDLVVAGSSKGAKKWQSYAQQTKIYSKMHFLGFRLDIPDILKAADCLVAPSRYEPYGLVAQEALCCGLPAFVSYSSGIAERYPDILKEFLSLNPNDINDLVYHLKNWRRNIDRYRELVRPFSEQLRSYSWDDMAEHILKIININTD